MKFFDRFKKKDSTPLQGAPEEVLASEDKKAEDKESKKKIAKVTAKKSDKKEKKDKPKERELKDTKGAHKVLLKPIITEKATLTGTYIFEISPNSNKNEVKKAIFQIYGVKPKAVRIMNVKGKSVRWNNRDGVRKSWKKAIVLLSKGETINVYEGT